MINLNTFNVSVFKRYLGKYIFKINYVNKMFDYV